MSSEKYVQSARDESEARGQRPDERPPAMLEGKAIPWAELRPFVVEAAGGAALEEVVLDRLLEREAAQAGITVGPAEIERERALLQASLVGFGGAKDADAAARLLVEVRKTRGLGPTRFAALLRRTALMRRLVQPDVKISDNAIRQAYDMAHGERRRVRLITVASASDAQSVVDRLAGADAAAFGALAAQVSTDASSARGGILEAVSLADPSYPQSLRSAIGGLSPGSVSPPIALDSGFAIVFLEQIVPGDGVSFDQDRTDAEARARLAMERALMDRLASRLLNSAGVNVLDPSLRSSWDARRGARSAR